jgi:osmotically-inducible protein OsmY
MNPNVRKTLIASLVAASLGIAGIAAANDHTDRERDRTVGQAIDDATITASVKAKLLEDDRTEGFDINVDTVNGRVTLRGGADSAADRMIAGDIARTTEGVTAVDNQITVAASGSEARQDANQATASGEVREAAEDAGDEMSDAWITSKVKTALVADADIAGLAINVETEDKAVRLIGDVPSEAVRAEAVRIAEATDGVSKVDASRLVVRADLRATR